MHATRLQASLFAVILVHIYSDIACMHHSNYIAPKMGLSHYFLISAAKLVVSTLFNQQCKMWAYSELLRMCNTMNIIKLFSQWPIIQIEKAAYYSKKLSRNLTQAYLGNYEIVAHNSLLNTHK